MKDIKNNIIILLKKILESSNFPPLIIYGIDINKYDNFINLISDKYNIKEFFLKKDYDIDYLLEKKILILDFIKIKNFNNLFKLLNYLCKILLCMIINI